MINTYKEVNTMDQQIVIKPYQKDWVEEYIKEKEILFLVRTRNNRR